MIIDTDNYDVAGIEVIQFAGGEWHCKVPKLIGGVVHIHAKIRTWDDMGKLMVVADALAREYRTVYIFAPYLPGARQDRVTSPGSPLTAEIYAAMFQQITEVVTTVDIHSTAALEMYKKHVRTESIVPHRFIADLIEDQPGFVICPDNGAKARAQQAAFVLGPNVGILNCSKERDPATGQLTNFVVPALPSADRFLIVDDICDGGGTFVGLLEEIRKQSTAPVDLFVTHGIFSKGISVLSGFDKIYTTDSFYVGHTGERLHTISLLPYYLGGLRP